VFKHATLSRDAKPFRYQLAKILHQPKLVYPLLQIGKIMTGIHPRKLFSH
jgi:hypothetical protein